MSKMNNTKGTNNKTQKSQTRGSVNSKVVNIESIYRQMKDTLAKRAALQKRQDDLWVVIKKHHCNKRSEISTITKRIGQTTHRLNGLIGQLCIHKKTHKAMNLACLFLNSEIERATQIIHKQEENVRLTETGKRVLISSDGKITTSTRDLRKYIAEKKNQVSRLQKWKSHVQKYMA